MATATIETRSDFERFTPEVLQKNLSATERVLGAIDESRRTAEDRRKAILDAAAKRGVELRSRRHSAPNLGALTVEGNAHWTQGGYEAIALQIDDDIRHAASGIDLADIMGTIRERVALTSDEHSAVFGVVREAAKRKLSRITTKAVFEFCQSVKGLALLVMPHIGPPPTGDSFGHDDLERWAATLTPAERLAVAAQIADLYSDDCQAEWPKHLRACRCQYCCCHE